MRAPRHVETQLLEALCLADRELLVADVLQRRAAPEPERVGQQPARRGVIAAGERGASLGGQALEPLRVDGVRAVESQLVAIRPPDDRLLAEHAAQARDDDLERVRRMGGQRVAPQRVDGDVGRHRPSASTSSSASSRSGRPGHGSDAAVAVRSLRRVRGSGTALALLARWHDSAMTARSPLSPARAHDCVSLSRRLGRCRRGSITLAATAASTYALDAVATAAGVLLVAIAAAERPRPHGSCSPSWPRRTCVWGVGLRANLRANWLLLRRTGTSTNVLSKAAFELARRRGASDAADRGGRGLRRHRARQGGALLRGRVRRRGPDRRGLVQRGAALPRGREPRGRRLRVRPRPLDAQASSAPARCASFDTDWVPQEYLADYYSVVEPDERETIAFFADAMTRRPRPASRSWSSAPGPRCITSSSPRRRPRSSTSPTTCLRTSTEIERWRDPRPRRARLARRSSATRSNAKASRTRPTRRSRGARSSPAPRSRGCSRSTRADPSRSTSATPRSSAPTARTPRPTIAPCGRR